MSINGPHHHGHHYGHHHGHHHNHAHHYDPIFMEETNPDQLGHREYSSIGSVQLEATLDHLVVIFTKSVHNHKLHRFHIPWHQITGMGITLRSCRPPNTNVQHLQCSVSFAHYGALPRLMRIRVDSRTRTLEASVYESKHFGSLLRDMVRLNLLPKLNGSGKYLMVWRLSTLDSSSPQAIRVKGGRIVNGRFEGAAGELTEVDVAEDYEFEIKPRVKEEVASDYNSGEEEDSALARETNMNVEQEEEEVVVVEPERARRTIGQRIYF